jgi:YD repeat-containing protein
MAHNCAISSDPGGYFSTLQYNFDFGAITRTQDPKGAAFTREYDWAGRLIRQTNLVNQAYTRYYYAPSHYYVQSWTTVNDLNPNNEFYSITLFDGANRTRATIEDHPGSVGGQRSVYNVYDNRGRLWLQSNPTEIDFNWAPAGDDQTNGYVWKQQAYDWNSRPTITTNTDGTQRIVEYSSCGCAGGTEVTVKDEGQTVNGVLQRRKQTTTHDVFGRAFKTQTFAWDTTTIYSTTSGTYQEIVMNYDGHGRLQTRQYPIESAATTFTYYNDDRPLSITDARSAAATYSYNSRGLQTGVSYTVPSGVAATPNVSFSYDEVGNRLQMNDGQGQTNYVYDTLSRLTAETRTFTGLPGSYQLTYTHNLAGQLTSYTDVANNNTINYAYAQLEGDTPTSVHDAPLGAKSSGYVYAGGDKLAEHHVSYYNFVPSSQLVRWVHNDPVTGAELSSYTGGGAYLSAEYDPVGVMPGFEDPAQQNPPPLPDLTEVTFLPEEPVPGGPSCTLDGISVPCALAYRSVQSGSAVVAPAQTVRRVIYQGQPTWAYWQATADGYQGYVPVTARYSGKGFFKPLNGEPFLRTPGSPQDTDFHTLNGATGEALLRKTVASVFSPRVISSRRHAHIAGILRTIVRRVERAPAIVRHKHIHPGV